MAELLEDIAANVPGAQYVSHDPPIITIDDFLTDEECASIIEIGTPGLEPSTGTGGYKNGKFQRIKDCVHRHSSAELAKMFHESTAEMLLNVSVLINELRELLWPFTPVGARMHTRRQKRGPSPRRAGTRRGA